MIIHLSVLFVIILVSLIFEQREKHYALGAISRGHWFITLRTPWVIIFGYVAYLAAMRTGMNDSSAYVHSFSLLPATWEAFWTRVESAKLGTDWAFDTVGILFKMFVSEDYHAWFALFAVAESLSFVYILRRNAVSILDCCFFFFCSTLYYNYFSMMRQWFAVVMIFAASHYIAEGKFLRFVTVCLIVGQFHSSALMVIPLYFAVRGRAWSTKQNMLIIVFVLGILFVNPIMSGLEDALDGTTYDYAISAMASGSGSSFIRAFIAAVPVLLAYVYRDGGENPMIDVCINMSVINFLLNVLASVTSGLYVIRFATYTSVFSLILYPYLLNVTITGKNRRTIKCLFYVVYLAFYFYQMKYQGAFGYSSDILGKYY